MLSKFFKAKPIKARQSDAPFDDPIQIIGRETLAAAHDPEGRVLLYAEIEDGVISADIFSLYSGKVRFRFAPEALKTSLYSFWAAGDAKHRWATMTMVMDGGQFKIDYGYPDAQVPGESLHDRRPRVVNAQFGELPIDYSSPR